MTSHAPNGEKFFFFYALALFLAVVIGFPAHYLVNGAALQDHLRPLLHVHAVLMGGWFSLLVLQTGLIGRGAIELHKTLGVASLILVAAMIPVGMLVSYQNMVRTDDALVLNVNIVNIATFSLLYGSALLFRSVPKFHKRMMLYAGLSLMLPAFARWTFALNINDLFGVSMWSVFAVAVPMRDFAVDRTGLKFSLLGLFAMVAQFMVIATLAFG